MALPAINIRVQSDTTDAVAGLNRVDDALERVETQSHQTGTAARSMANRLSVVGGVSAQTRGKIQQVSFQLQDLAVQMSSGTRASVALAQQLPQLAGAFGAVGAVVGVMAAVGIPALAYVFNQTEDEAKNLADAINEIRKQAVALRDETRSATLGLVTPDELRLMDRIKEINLEISKIESDKLKLTKSGRQTADAMLATRRQERAELQSQLDEIRNASQERDRMIKLTRETADAERLLGEQMAEVARQAAVAANETQRMRDAAMDAAREFITVQAIRSRFAGEDALMGMPVVVPGRGEPPPSVGGGIGGGGGGIGSDGRLQALMESLQTERETIETWYTESLELLATANASELEAIGGHNEARLRLEQEYQDRLRGLRSGYNGDALAQAGTFFGQMADAARMGGEKTVKAARIFGAAQALINSYVAYTEVLRDPLLPWFMRIPAAAGVLGAGLGMVNAIKSTSGAASSASPAIGASAASAQPQISRNIVLELQGETFGRRQVISLINQINEAVEDGAELRLT